MNEEEAKADEAYFNLDTKNGRYRARANKGCAWVFLAWLILMALACLGWFGGQVYQVWNG